MFYCCCGIKWYQEPRSFTAIGVDYWTCFITTLLQTFTHMYTCNFFSCTNKCPVSCQKALVQSRESVCRCSRPTHAALAGRARGADVPSETYRPIAQFIMAGTRYTHTQSAMATAYISMTSSLSLSHTHTHTHTHTYCLLCEKRMFISWRNRELCSMKPSKLSVVILVF